MNTTTKKIGFIEMNAVATTIGTRVIDELYAAGETDLTKTQVMSAVMFHPDVLALFDQMDEELYIAEYVEATRATAAGLGISTYADAVKFVEHVRRVVMDHCDTPTYERYLEIYGPSTERCYEAFIRSYE